MDRMSKERRSALMSRIRSKNTKPELVLFSYLMARRVRFVTHYDAPGKPDVAVPSRKLAVFMHGTFWHGWQFPRWRHKLAGFWAQKIEANRARDRRNIRRLRRAGWRVLVVWEHDLRARRTATLRRVADFLGR